MPLPLFLRLRGRRSTGLFIRTFFLRIRLLVFSLTSLCYGTRRGDDRRIQFDIVSTRSRLVITFLKIDENDQYDDPGIGFQLVSGLNSSI